MKKRLGLVFVFVAVGLDAGLADELMKITGQVHDDEARVVGGADIAIYELHGDDYYSPRSARLLHTPIKSDVEGRFVFNVMAEPHHDIYVIARKEGLALGWDYLHKKVDIYKRARNLFNIVDQRNIPVVGKSVNIHSQISGDLFHKSSSTDDQGQFKFNRLPEGPVTLQVGSYGGGLDAAFVWAHSGDHVRIKLGEHHRDYISPTSLVGKPLPDLSSLEIGLDPRRVKDKKTLVCFVDVTQYASQSAVKYLNKIRYDLEQRNIATVCVQVTPIDEEEFNAWKKDNKIRLPIASLPGDIWWKGRKELVDLNRPDDRLGILAEKWGVRSLPWMILTDENQTIMATGFEYARILQLVPEKKTPIRLRSNRR